MRTTDDFIKNDSLQRSRNYGLNAVQLVDCIIESETKPLLAHFIHDPAMIAWTHKEVTAGVKQVTEDHNGCHYRLHNGHDRRCITKWRRRNVGRQLR